MNQGNGRIIIDEDSFQVDFAGSGHFLISLLNFFFKSSAQENIEGLNVLSATRDQIFFAFNFNFEKRN